MNTKECEFTKDNLLFSIWEDGRLFVANKDDGHIYEVKVVKRLKENGPETRFPGSKTVKIKKVDFGENKHM